MKNSNLTGSRMTGWIRWTARVTGLLNGMVWLSQVPGIMVYSNIPIPLPVQVALLITPMAGVIIAWRWEGIGGAVLVTGAIVFCVLPAMAYAAAGRGLNLSLTGTLLILPGLIAGVLFLICWKRERSLRFTGKV